MKYCEVSSLKEALHNCIHRHPTKKVTTIAEEIGMGESYLYRAALPDPDTAGPNASGVKFPLKRLIPLIRSTNDFQVLDFIERSLGRVAFKLPTPGGDPKQLHKHLTTTVAEFGDVCKEFSVAVKDGSISRVEAERFSKQAHEAIHAIVDLDHAMKEASK